MRTPDKHITEKQANVLKWIIDFFFKNLTIPTTREIAEGMGFNQTCALSFVTRLVHKELLLDRANKSRCYIPNWDMVLCHSREIWTDVSEYEIDTGSEVLIVASPDSYVVAMYCIQQKYHAIPRTVLLGDRARLARDASK